MFGILNMYGLSTREINNEKEDFFIPDLDILENKSRVKKLDPVYIPMYACV